MKSQGLLEKGLGDFVVLGCQGILNFSIRISVTITFSWMLSI